MRVAVDDVLDADEGAGNHCDEREHHEENVLPQEPSHRAEAAVGGQINDLDESRHEESEAAEEDGTDQADERLEIWNCDGQGTHEEDDESSQSDLRQVAVLRQSRFEFLEDDFHRNVELQTESEEDREPDEYLTGDGVPHIGRQVQCDAALDGVAESNVSEEAHDRVKNGDGDHCDEKNARLSEELFWLQHRILDRHDCADAFHCEDHRAGDENQLVSRR